LNGLEKRRGLLYAKSPLGQSAFDRFWSFSGDFFPGGSFAVDHLEQAESAGGSGGSGHQPVLRFQDFLHSLRRPFAPANFDQCADDDPHHVLEESAAIDRDGDEIILLRNGQPVDLPHRGFGSTTGALERFEIMLAHQVPGGLSHGGHIQGRNSDVMRHPALQSRGVIPVENRVPVGLAGGGYLRMKIGLRLLDLFHHDIRRKQAVQRLQNLLRFHGGRRLEMSHLPFGMHPGIGPAGPDHPGLFLGDFVQFALENALDAHLLDLELPAAIAGAFILDQDSYSSHVCSVLRKETGLLRTIFYQQLRHILESP
jgi:hypothetical protein